MKKLFLFISLFIVISVSAQTEAEKVLQRVQELNNAVFVTKDSIVLEGLMAEEVSYGHSSGKIENRQQMIHNAVTSASLFSNVLMEISVVYFQNKTAIVRHQLKANAKDTTGKESLLNIGVLQVWVKQKGNWRLTARQAVKL